MHRLVPDRPEAVRRRGIERDRPACVQLVLVEANTHAERSARDIAVLTAAVRHERILRARLGTHRVRDVEELDVAVAVRREALPPDTGGEVDHAPRLRALCQAVGAADLRGGTLPAS